MHLYFSLQASQQDNNNKKTRLAYCTNRKLTQLPFDWLTVETLSKCSIYSHLSCSRLSFSSASLFRRLLSLRNRSASCLSNSSFSLSILQPMKPGTTTSLHQLSKVLLLEDSPTQETKVPHHTSNAVKQTTKEPLSNKEGLFTL